MKERFFQRKQYNQHELRREYGKNIMKMFNEYFEEHAQKMREEYAKVGLSPSEIDERMANLKRELQVKVIDEAKKTLIKVIREKQQQRRLERKKPKFKRKNPQ